MNALIRKHPLRSRSEAVLRNLVVVALIAFFVTFFFCADPHGLCGQFPSVEPTEGSVSVERTHQLANGVDKQPVLARHGQHRMVFGGRGGRARAYWAIAGERPARQACKVEISLPHALLSAHHHTDGRGGVRVEVHVPSPSSGF